ncbi:MAG TPA: hypothetical protein VK506_14295, partial [Conexibacter sp.]|nr:hypothetical protein [Conexibacter sp.]
MTTIRLVRALQGRQVQTGELVRHGLRLRRWLDRGLDAPGRGAQRRGIELEAVSNIDFTFPAPELVVEAWRRSGPEQRTDIERALLAAAEQAIVHLIVGRSVTWERDSGGTQSKRARAEGVAAVAAVHPVELPGKSPEAPAVELHVHSIMLGAKGAAETLGPISLAKLHYPMVQRKAMQLAWRTLADELPGLTRYSGRQAAAAAAVPEHALGAPGSAARQPTEADPPRRIYVPWRDPLERWRETLGDWRAERIGERADERRDRLGRNDHHQLLAYRRVLQATFAPPDRATARQALSLERDVARLEERANVARRDAARLEDEAPFRRKRRERTQFLETAAVIRDRIAAEESLRDQMLHTDARLPARDSLDAWMSSHTEKAAELVAVDRILSRRLHRTIVAAVDRATHEAPDYVRTAIGDPPEPSAPEHDEWVALTSALVHDHHVAAAHAAGFEPFTRSPREHRELD